MHLNVDVVRRMHSLLCLARSTGRSIHYLHNLVSVQRPRSTRSSLKVTGNCTNR